MFACRCQPQYRVTRWRDHVSPGHGWVFVIDAGPLRTFNFMSWVRAIESNCDRPYSCLYKRRSNC